MPITGTIYRDDYPISGWSNWFGAPIFAPFPYGLPYGVFLKAGGSTGRFAPFNQGMFFECVSTWTTGSMFYAATEYIGGSDFPPTLLIEGNFGHNMRFTHIPWRGLPPFPFQYFCQTIQAWPNPRKPVLMATNGSWVPPILSGQMGPNTTITPFNRKGYLEAA